MDYNELVNIEINLVKLLDHLKDTNAEISEIHRIYTALQSIRSAIKLELGGE